MPPFSLCVQADGFLPPSLVLVHSMRLWVAANPVHCGSRNVFPFSLWPNYLLFTFLWWATGSGLCSRSPAYHPWNPQSTLSCPLESSYVHSPHRPYFSWVIFKRNITQPGNQTHPSQKGLWLISVGSHTSLHQDWDPVLAFSIWFGAFLCL